MTKNGEAIQVEIEEGAQIIFVEVERKKECADVIAVPEYLPEGYEVWDEEKEKYSLGKYSFGGVWGANGITILVDEWMEKEQFPYKTCEIWQTGNVKKLLIDRGEESGYRWGLLQFYEKEGYVVQMFAASFIPKEEVLEIGKQISCRKNFRYIRCFTAHLWKMNRHTILKEEFLTASIMESIM